MGTWEVSLPHRTSCRDRKCRASTHETTVTDQERSLSTLPRSLLSERCSGRRKLLCRRRRWRTRRIRLTGTIEGAFEVEEQDGGDLSKLKTVSYFSTLDVSSARRGEVFAPYRAARAPLPRVERGAVAA